MAADETALGKLHTQVAHVLSKALEGQTIKAEEDGEEDMFIPPSAAIIQAATKFLKDNEITCIPSKDNALGELEEKMRARQERRKINAADLQVAREDNDFMRGLN